MRLLSALLVSMIGCGGVTFDMERLSQEERNVAETAIGKWYEAGCDFNPGMTGKTIHMFFSHFEGAERTSWTAFTRQGGSYDAIVLNLGLEWSTEDSCPIGVYHLGTTILHELGHVNGLEHSDDPEDVMYYGQWPAQVRRDFSKNDLRQIQGSSSCSGWGQRARQP